MDMARAEPPPKKRKLLEAPPSSPSPYSQEEIARKSKNKDELRALFESYKRIRACVDKKDPRAMPDLEQAYLSLISKSQGCSSVQRIVAELIPRYVSYCPSALEASSKVSINMYKWSLNLISNRENNNNNTDQSAFHTAKACVIGLAEMCHTELDKVSTLSVIKNILEFFVSSFEGKDIYRIGRDLIEKLQDPMEFLYDMKMENEDECDEWNNERCLDKLFEIRVLSLLCMFVSSPKSLIEACFSESDSLSESGFYFVNQICRDFKGEKERENDTGTGLAMQYNCFLEMVIKRDPTFKSWIISKQKNISNSEISSLVERVLSSLPETADEKESEDVPMDLTEESPEIQPLKINIPTETFTTENNKKSKNENIPNISTNNNATQTPQNKIFDFNPNGVSSFIISASKELWISYQNTNASEPSLRSKFEEFGPIIKSLFYPPKKFAIIEYKNIYDSVKAHGFMQGSSIWGGGLRVKFLDSGLGFKGFTEGVGIGDSCFLYVGNVLSQHERDEILNDLSRSGSKRPVSIKDLKSENAVLMEFGSAEEAAVAKAQIRSRTSAPGRGLNMSAHHEYYSAQQSPMPSSNDSAGPCTPHTPGPHTPGPQTFRPNWPMDPSYPCPSPSPSSTDRQAPHGWPHRSHPVPPPVLPPPVSPSFRPLAPPSFLPPTNQISPRVIPPGNFRTPLPFIPSSVTPLSQIPGASLQENLFPSASLQEKMFPGAPLQEKMFPGASLQEKIIPGASLQNFNRIAAALPPPPPHVVVAPFVPPAQQVGNSGESVNSNKWRGVLSKSGVNYCTLYAVREESDGCRYMNGASEPKDWPSKLDVTKRTDLKNVRTTFSNVSASKKEVCRLLPTSASDQKGLGEFTAYLKQRECAGVIKIPGLKPMWSRLLFILPHSADICKMLGINPSPSDCLIALVLPKDTNAE